MLKNLCNVARTEPAVFCESFLVRLIIVEVTRKDRLTFDLDFTDVTNFIEANSFLINYANLNGVKGSTRTIKKIDLNAGRKMLNHRRVKERHRYFTTAVDILEGKYHMMKMHSHTFINEADHSVMPYDKKNSQLKTLIAFAVFSRLSGAPPHDNNSMLERSRSP